MMLKCCWNPSRLIICKWWMDSNTYSRTELNWTGKTKRRRWNPLWSNRDWKLMEYSNTSINAVNFLWHNSNSMYGSCNSVHTAMESPFHGPMSIMKALLDHKASSGLLLRCDDSETTPSPPFTSWQIQNLCEVPFVFSITLLNTFLT